MPLPYDAHEIESRWQTRWDADCLYDIDRQIEAPVFTNLVEFPYPSGDGLHVGHVFKYGGADVFGRYQRMRGHSVFQPIGFDSFGINAENYAMRLGEHPASVMARTTARFRRQLSRVGIGWDWSATLRTSDPAYYRWTQWVFCRLFEAGLAYRSASDDQWYLRITAYADRLRDGLAALHWPEVAKRQQRDWIANMHDWLISRQRYWGPPIPIVHCPACGPVLVPDDELPVLLPDENRPLAENERWAATNCPQCDGPARRETDVADTFFDSSWYFLRYPSVDIEDRPWDVERTARFLPASFYAGGPEHVRRHHLYARFVTMALSDMGLVPFDEPFPRIRLGGLIRHDGAKMSKSRGNVVDPDDYVDRHGGDVLRLFLLFSGPWEEGGDFTDQAVVGVERFLGRVWRRVVDANDRADADRTAKAIFAVTDAIEKFRFNVAIAALMAAVDDIDPPTLVLLLAPLAPYVAEELWHRLGREYSVHQQRWPTVDRAAAGGTETVNVVVQVDGRRRARLSVERDVDDEALIAAASAAVEGWLVDRAVERVVRVPNRLVNFVTFGG